ncbi:ketopantoate reductase family protein [Nonomuraea sp. MG754425]|uniref:ketopantoate reductase family protein n=1 Tax=Nonomuraea sp. MG754425 TaxID=2570319 RepID=UPI001F20789B|nr:2-dehydropantoate 2-reductase N-terminal domain-containing protein [Nonomuraea sp. MG754425]MCF6466886.1 ketopantoate reductase family protein [Nonomuraea sp. MG754425]
MRYIVIGAGAVGGTIGARLYQGGHDVHLIARGAHYEAIKRDGLRLVTPDGSETLDIPASDGPVPTRDDDVLILATKSQDTISALAPWSPDLPVVCAQNGVANERMVLRRFDRVYGVCVWLPAQIPQPGVIAAHAHPYSGMLHLGRYPQGVDDLAAKIADDFGKRGLVGRAVPDVMRWKYAKLLSNLGNAAEALLGHGPALHEVVGRARAEARAVLEHAGIAYATAEEEAEIRGHKVDAQPIEGIDRSGGSSWQSLARGAGSIEADYLNGEIVLLGREHGLPTPVNETLRREANRAAREKLPPGSMPPETLLALIDGRSAA